MSTAIKPIFLSSISNGESITGFIYRSQFNFGHSLWQELWNAIGKPKNGKFSWLLPSSLNLISEIFGEAVGDTKSILGKNTLFPAFSRFLPQQNRDLLEQHYCLNSVRGIGSTVGLHRLNPSGRVFGICKKCLMEDISSDGRSFWRREFMMPAIEFCWKHLEPLEVGCNTCILDYGKPDAVLFTGKNCVCDVNRNFRLSTYTSDDIESLVDLSFGFSRLLDPKTLPNVEFDDIKFAIAHRSIELDLTKNEMLNRTRIVEFFDANKLVASKDKRLIFGISWLTLTKVLTGKELPPNPISSIRLLSVLFGDWQEVENQLMNVSNLERTSKNSMLPFEVSTPNRKRNRRKPNKNPTVIKEERFLECVKAYRDVRDRFPNETHSDLLRRLPSTVGLILSRKRLMSIGERMPITNSGEEYYKLLDISLEKHIRSNRSLLLSTCYHRRISKHVLLNGHSMVSAWARIKPSLPRSRSALEECEETSADYRKRKLVKQVVEESAIKFESLNAIDVHDDAE